MRMGTALSNICVKPNSGLINQGWKEFLRIRSFTPMVRWRAGLIARCEVQGYVFAAKTQAAKLAHRMGQYDLEIKLHREAQVLRKNFEAACWCEDIGTFALALDGNKTPCRVRTSNAGHTLFMDSAARAGRARRRKHCSDRIFQRLGDQNGREWRGAVQSDFLSQWLDLAARQCDDRTWLCPLWLRIAHDPSLLRNVRSCGLSGVKTRKCMNCPARVNELATQAASIESRRRSGRNEPSAG